MKLLVVLTLSTVSKLHWSVSVRKPPPGKRFKYKLQFVLYMANILLNTTKIYHLRITICRYNNDDDYDDGDL